MLAPSSMSTDCLAHPRSGWASARRLVALVALVVAATALLRIPPASAVHNDSFANAQVISGASGSLTHSNVGATKQSGEPDHAGNPGGHSIWYSWTAPKTAWFEFDTCGSNFDTLLGIYTGNAVGALTTIASNDDGGCPNNNSRVEFSATAGVVYRVAVDGYSDSEDTTTTVAGGSGGASGNVSLAWSQLGPSLTTQADPVDGDLGTAFHDVATLTGGGSGTVTFQLFNDVACTSAVFVSTTPVSGGIATSGSVVPAFAGTYRWVATFSPDDDGEGGGGYGAGPTSCTDPLEQINVFEPDTGPPPTAPPTTTTTAVVTTTTAPVTTTTVPASTTTSVPGTTTVPPTTAPGATTTVVATNPPATTPGTTTLTTVPASTTVPPQTTTTRQPGTTTTTTTPPRPPVGTTLTALTPDGAPAGPPGVALNVAGTGYSACKTVYFFFDGVRIGSDQPDAAGAVSAKNLSVPGDTSSGQQTVTSSCRPAEDPVRASTVFTVTDARVHRSALVTSVDQPGQISLRLGPLAASAAAAVAMLLLFAFPFQLFNSTVEANYDEIRGWFRLPARVVDATAQASRNLAFFLLTLVTGVVVAFLSPDFGFNLTTLVQILGFCLGLLVMSIGFSLPSAFAIHRATGEWGKLNFLPGTVLVSIVMVALSRLMHFQPGYMYGALAGLAFASAVSKRAQGRISAANWVFAFVISIGAFLVRGPVSHLAAEPGASVWWIGLEAALVLIFLWGVEGLAVGMLPMRFLAGRLVKDWNTAVWGLLMFIGLFATVHTLLAPNSGYVGHTTGEVTVGVVVLFLIFGAVSVGLWSYFRYRPERWNRNPGERVGEEFLNP